MNKLIGLAGLTALTMTLGCASTATPPPTTTPDGLELVSSDKHSAVYIKPDAQLTIYETFGVVPCKVAFRKNWQRDYNSAHRSSSQPSQTASRIRSADSAGRSVEPDSSSMN